MLCLQRTRVAHWRFERHLLVACLEIYVMLTKTSIKSSTSSPRLDELAKAGLSMKVGQETTKPIQSCQGGVSYARTVNYTPPLPLVNILKTQYLHVTLCTLQILLQFFSKDNLKTSLTSNWEPWDAKRVARICGGGGPAGGLGCFHVTWFRRDGR